MLDDFYEPIRECVGQSVVFPSRINAVDYIVAVWLQVDL